MANSLNVQSALVFPALRAPFQLESKHPIPTAEKGEIRVKIHSVGLNPVDWKIQRGDFDHWLDGKLPAVISGLDIAGEVDELGEDVSTFVKGDRVFMLGTFLDSRKAGWQQYTIALASTVAKIPEGLSYDDVIAIPTGLTTAYVGLYNRYPHGLGFTPPTITSSVGKYKDVPFLVIGGSTIVGQHVIQLAKHSGFNPIITTASLKHRDALLALGATHVISRDLQFDGIQGEISSATKGSYSTLPSIFDTVSTLECQRLGIQLLSPNGRLITVLDNEVPLDEISDGKATNRVWAILRKPENVELLEELYGTWVERFLINGVLKPLRTDIIPGGLLGIVPGLRRLELDEVSRLKLAVHPWETPHDERRRTA